MLGHLPLSVAAKIGFAKFAGREYRSFVDGSGESAFIERHARQYTDFHLLTKRKQVCLGGLIEDVVDHLYRVDQAGLDGLERRSGRARSRKCRSSELCRFSANLQWRAATLPCGPGVRPYVKLLQVDLSTPRLRKLSSVERIT